MSMSLIQKEMMHHILSAQFVALLVMCLLLIPLTLSINHQNYRQSLVDYQEAIKLAKIEDTTINPQTALDPEREVSKLFLKPTPLSVFANGLAEALPRHLGMTRNGIVQGSSTPTASIFHLLGHFDFLFVVGTVFSLLALLFSFDAVAGEREAGTLRINLANPLPRDIFLWSKLTGGYIVFMIPFLVSFLFGLLLIVWQGFPLGEPEIFPRVLSLMFVSFLYIAVFFAIGTVISTYLDSSKTALIVAFTIWVFAVLIIPRVGFLTAKLIAPTQTPQSVYMEKTAIRGDFDAEIQKEKEKIINQIPPDENGAIVITGEALTKVDEAVKPFEEEYRLKFRELSDELDRNYKREIARQERIGETLARITPTSSLIYLVTNLTGTGQLKKRNYFDAGERYYDMLYTDLFSKIVDHVFARTIIPTDAVRITQPPLITTPSLAETFRHSLMDGLLLCFFAVVLTTVAFLKFFRSDI